MIRRWMKRSPLFVFIVTTILVAVMLIASRNPASISDHWQGANEAPGGLMGQVVGENIRSNSPIDPGRMKVWKIQQPGQKMPLYLVDSRVTDLADYPHANPLCGVSGCAFFAYLSVEGQFQQVWSEYLNVNLLPGVTLIQPDRRLKNGLPELTIHQMKGNQIQTLQLTFNGQFYETTKVLLQPQIYD